MINDWINNPHWTFSQKCLYVCYRCSIDWLKHIINVTFIDNYFYFWAWIKIVILCFITSLSIILNTKTNVFMNLKPFNWVNNFIDLFLVVDSASSHSVRLGPEVLRTSPKDVQWTSSDGPLCNAKGRPLPRSLGRWNTTSWGRPHTVLYLASWDIPYWRLEDVYCRCYVYLSIRSNIYLQGTCAAYVLRTFLGNVLRTS